MTRTDYAFPFRIDNASGQGAQTSYESHVNQMIRQILLTAQGERADLPECGCGLKQLIFAPHTSALDSAATILVQQSLNRWLSDQIIVQNVHVGPPAAGEEEQLVVQITYTLIETQTSKQLAVVVS